MKRPRPVQTWEVWVEGYAATGEHGTAHKVGDFAGYDFSEACRSASKKHKWGNLFDAKRLTYWGCRLFDNGEDARRSYG